MVLLRLALVAVCLAFATSASAGDMVIQQATWYCGKYHGRLMANGQRYDCHDTSTVAANKRLRLRLGARVRGTNNPNGRTPDAVVRDRSPKSLLDVSLGGARLLGFERQGIATLRVALLSH